MPYPTLAMLRGMKTRITELFNIRHPIIQGGMHYVGFARLAAAVSNAGGLGVITGLTLGSPERLAREIGLCRQMTDQPFGVNLTFLPAVKPPDYPGLVQAIVAASELDTRLVMRPLRNTERVLNNPSVQRLLEKEKALGSAVKFEDIAAEVAGVYPKIMLEGEIDGGAWSCGMVAGLIHDVPTCKELIDNIIAEAEALVRQRLEAMFEPPIA
jgi:NAD(P)H-dependent flavin oxidoreductase YrpB (nitropropane dioxygenase family)